MRRTRIGEARPSPGRSCRAGTTDAWRLDGAGAGRCITPCLRYRIPLGPRRKAYWSEQILSSSLFRLYRCIGGDTTLVTSPSTPDLHARRSASHYCVYLIMRAIQILGTSLAVPANDPDQFVSALIDTDVNTALSTPWYVLFPPVFSSRQSRHFREDRRLRAQGDPLGVRSTGVVNLPERSQRPGHTATSRHLHRGPSPDFRNHAVRRYRLWPRQLQSGFT